MTRDEAIRGRRSVRKFLDKTIPQETLREEIYRYIVSAHTR